jgi:mono/diheme cytochrome c family protein
MRYLFAVTLVGVWVLAGVASAQDAATMQRAQKAYAAEKCSRCHSIAGKGNSKGKLDDVGSKLSEEEIRQWLVNAEEMTKKAKATRKPPMKSHKLSKEDLDALVAYMMSLKSKS